MYKLNKLTLATVAVIASASAPSTAYARLNLENGSPPPPPAVNWQAVQNATRPSARPAATASPQGFQWDDAGIGAAGALVLLGVGSGAAVALRRRTVSLA